MSPTVFKIQGVGMFDITSLDTVIHGNIYRLGVAGWGDVKE